MGFLGDLLPKVRARVEDPGYLGGLPTEPPRPAPSLRDAIVRASGSWAVLVERKHASPGAVNSTLPQLPLDRFVDLAQAGNADGLSCLATSPAFGGSPREVAELVTRSQLPVLFKDFVIARVQVEAAYRCGASAILLIARLETGGYLEIPLRELASAARARGLEVVLEVHGPDEWSLALEMGADIFGVNLRDLDTLDFRPDVAEATFHHAAARHPLLGLSGVRSSDDAVRFRGWGADGLLVGSGFALARDPAAFLRSLRADGRR